MKIPEQNTTLSFEDYKIQVLEDYKIMVASRETSLLGRREVLMGKGTFGIFKRWKRIASSGVKSFF